LGFVVTGAGAGLAEPEVTGTGLADGSGLASGWSVADGLRVAGASGVRGAFWLRTSDTLFGTAMIPPGLIATATAITVKNATAVKTSPCRPLLGTKFGRPRRGAVAQRACRA
jgi:hypothetical protein